ncbi:MAG: hypothetical protein KDB90_02895 [Planctomycetes bacterium]|nr:hypothetical protein [Planctomycetota bacterium]
MAIGAEMRIMYQVKPTYEGYWWAEFVNDEDRQYFGVAHPRPAAYLTLREQWRARHLRYYNNPEFPGFDPASGQCPVFLSFDSEFAVSSQKAEEVIRTLGVECELLPMMVSGEDYQWLRLPVLQNTVDITKSTYDTYSTGDIRNITSYWFNYDSIGEHQLFRIIEYRSTRIFCTEQFRETYHDCRYTGMRFLEVDTAQPQSQGP